MKFASKLNTEYFSFTFEDYKTVALTLLSLLFIVSLICIIAFIAEV
jgi:hypothetical protein